jgi:hypothetical protein
MGISVVSVVILVISHQVIKSSSHQVIKPVWFDQEEGRVPAVGFNETQEVRSRHGILG